MKAYNLGGLEVLVVDDNENMLRLMREVLRALGIRRIHLADDVPSAHERMQYNTLDLIITDWRMEPVDGRTFVHQLRRDTGNPSRFVPVIMLSGYTEFDRVVEARDAGANEVMAKPVSAEAMYRRIVAIIETAREFIECPAYVGPDRRRRVESRYRGPERREVESSHLADAI